METISPVVNSDRNVVLKATLIQKQAIVKSANLPLGKHMPI